MIREYKSFKEIDERLEILRLQREIDIESVKLNLYKAKKDLIPKKLFQNLGRSLSSSETWKKILLTLAIKRTLRFFQKRREEKSLGM